MEDGDRGGRIHAPSSIHTSSPRNWWSRRVTLPHRPACRAGALLVCHDPLGKPSGCCPQRAEFWRLRRTAGARLAWKLVRLPGIAPGHAPWRGAILLLNHNREIERTGSIPAPGPCHFNKEQTPLGDLFDPNPRFHGGCFGV